MPTYHTTFISHAHADNTAVADYAARLRARGINLWLDLNDAQKGHDLSGDITAQLEARSALVLMETQASNESRWVGMEVSNFIALYNDKLLYRVNGVERIILPVRLEDVPIPGRLRAFNWIDAVGRSRDEVADEIARALHLGTIVQPPPRTSYPILARLDSLGFEGWCDAKGTPYIVPPVCAVPAGKFTMGSAQDDPDAEDDEKPQYRIDVAAFEIGTYPVTVAEYALAVQAEVLSEPQNLMQLNPNVSKKQPRTLTWEIQQQRPDHPVVCVSWTNARNYCYWLSIMTGHPWRLHTDAEWEKAARWEVANNHARKYPWGDQWDKTRANTNDGGPGLTTPIGTYAAKGDASPYNVHDMAGNVWEWTNTLWYTRPPYDATQHEKGADTSTARVLRGGSWVDIPQLARAAYRLGDVRSSWIIVRGFRVARAGGLVR